MKKLLLFFLLLFFLLGYLFSGYEFVHSRSSIICISCMGLEEYEK